MQGTEAWRFIVVGKTISVRPRGRFEADSGAALAAAAVVGLGVAALPDFLIDEHMASGALVAVTTDFSLPRLASSWSARPENSRPESSEF